MSFKSIEYDVYRFNLIECAIYNLDIGITFIFALDFLTLKHCPRSAGGSNQEQQLARERSLESAQAELQRRYHISDEAHPQQQQQGASADTGAPAADSSGTATTTTISSTATSTTGITDQVKQ